MASATKAIFKREFGSYFATPIALIFLCVFLMLTGFFTFKLGRLYEQGESDLRAFFIWHPWLYLFIVPAVSMRLWAEERKSGTIELLLTLPVSLTSAVVGKFLAAWAFLGLALVLTFPIVLSVAYLGDPDYGVVLTGYLGSFLMAGTFLAVGCAVSAATSNQVISFVVSTTICLVLILLGHDPVVDTLQSFIPQGLVDQLVNLSFPYHFEAIYRGVVDLRDLIFFALLSGLGLVSTGIILDRYKAD